MSERQTIVGSHNLWPYSGAADVAVAVGTAASAATKAKSTLPSVVPSVSVTN